MILDRQAAAKAIDRYWSDNPVLCANCGSEVRAERREIINSKTRKSEYYIDMPCSQCGHDNEAESKDDPKTADFRDWNDSEKAFIAQEYVNSGAVLCPICKVVLTTTLTFATSDTVNVSFNCPRCFHSHSQCLPR